jgi:GNAT superfamily N-acetyltransferase
VAFPTSEHPVGGGVSVRQASTPDARAIAEITVLAWQAAYVDILPSALLAGLSIEAREIAWRMRFEAEDSGIAPVWIAEREGQPIGFISSGPRRDDDLPREALEVYSIYVLPEAWRSGVGQTLMAAALDHAAGARAPVVVLWVLRDNRAGRAFYEKLGWRPDGAQQAFDVGDEAVPEVRYRAPSSI